MRVTPALSEWQAAQAWKATRAFGLGASAPAAVPFDAAKNNVPAAIATATESRGKGLAFLFILDPFFPTSGICK